MIGNTRQYYRDIFLGPDQGRSPILPPSCELHGDVVWEEELGGGVSSLDDRGGVGVSRVLWKS